jgi:large subunit ribosomal protein L20
MRVKRGFTRRRAHHKVLDRTKGFRMSKNRLYKVAREADLHAGQYAFIGRKRRKREFKKLWTIRLNGELKKYGLSYSRFAHLLKKAQIELNRKILADLVLNEPSAFQAVIDKVKKS